MQLLLKAEGLQSNHTWQNYDRADSDQKGPRLASFGGKCPKKGDGKKMKLNSKNTFQYNPLPPISTQNLGKFTSETTFGHSIKSRFWAIAM